MEHLFNSVVKVQRPETTQNPDGVAGTQRVDVTTGGLNHVKCRLDLQFIRPGKDAPSPINAGGAQDRYGVLFCRADVPLRAGDYLVCIPNSAGKLPVEGTFEIKSIPDKAMDFSDAHHIEVLVFEVTQDLTEDVWPEE